MVENKIEVLLRVSEVNLARAEKRFDDGEYDSAVFHASMAVESAANAMILELGGNEARNHGAISGLAAVLRRVKPELLREEKYARLIDRGREIQREVVYARYPLKVAGKWMTPMEYYTRKKTREIIDNAEFVVDGIKEYLKRATT
ncbi:MAG: HEPN domain-containing protein, partial [Candidatus Bathyarchaeota archaeon]|nr:HEPN domain-containing protein [Candidatus Bathyarchaeota archaeon]